MREQLRDLNGNTYEAPRVYKTPLEVKRDRLRRLGEDIAADYRQAAEKARRTPLAPSSAHRVVPVRRRPPGPLEVAALKRISGRAVPMERAAQR